MTKKISISIPNELNELMEREDLNKSSYISRLIHKDMVGKRGRVVKSIINPTIENELNEVFNAEV